MVTYVTPCMRLRSVLLRECNAPDSFVDFGAI